MARLSDQEVKALVVERNRLQGQRDALTHGLSPDAIKANPMAILPRLGGMMEAFNLTARIEEISNVLVSELVQKVAAKGVGNGEAS